MKIKYTQEAIQDFESIYGIDVMFPFILEQQNNRYDHPLIEPKSISDIVRDFLDDRKRFNMLSGY